MSFVFPIFLIILFILDIKKVKQITKPCTFLSPINHYDIPDSFRFRSCIFPYSTVDAANVIKTYYKIMVSSYFGFMCFVYDI